MLYEASIMVCHPHRLANNDKYHTGKHIWFHTQSGDDSKLLSALIMFTGLRQLWT